MRLASRLLMGLATTAVFCCLGLAAPISAPPNYQGLWWNAPPNSESGWGINVAHQGDMIFATWYTDASGEAWWISMTAVCVYSGTLYRTTGPAFGAEPFDPNLVTRAPVGTLMLTFTNGNAASMRTR